MRVAEQNRAKAPGNGEEEGWSGHWDEENSRTLQNDGCKCQLPSS